jgi:hypothetical protein
VVVPERDGQALIECWRRQAGEVRRWEGGKGVGEIEREEEEKEKKGAGASERQERRRGGREEDGGMHTSLRDPLSSSCVTISDEFLSWKHDMVSYDARTAGQESALPSKKRNLCPLIRVSESTVICPPCLLNVKAPRYMSLYRLRRRVGQTHRTMPPHISVEAHTTHTHSLSCHSPAMTRMTRHHVA